MDKAKETGCTCTPTDPSTWTTHYGAVEPGSQWEEDPNCPVHSMPTCYSCEKRRTDEPDFDPLDVYVTGRVQGWYSQDDGDFCPSCMNRSLGSW